MGFVKVVKNKAYHKRFQVKFARRREGKTDYRARTRMILQDKNKYNTPRYRLVVRFSNKDVTCQITYAKIKGDVVVSAAYSHELPRYGLKVGLTNYAAAYATGLLLARRTLSKFKLADKYEGLKEATGAMFNVANEGEGSNPFTAVLDVGLARTTTGARVFAAMKGAADGGMSIPHSEARFVGFDKAKKTLDAAKLRKYIYGGHVADYMSLLQTKEPEKYKKQFSKFIEAGVKPGDMEALLKKVHAAIRADPSPKPVGWKKFDSKKKPRVAMSTAQRKDRVKQKLAAAAKKASA
jgi:large subunit ribosomal protein L5e